MVIVEGIVEDPAAKIMATGGLLDARHTEVDVITLPEVDVITHPDILLMVEVEDQEGKGPGHTLLPDTVLKGTMHVVLGEIWLHCCSCFTKCRTILETCLNHILMQLLSVHCYVKCDQLVVL